MEKKFLEKKENLDIYEIHYNSEEVNKAERELINYVNTKYNIPGFRRGKTPVRIIKNFLGDNYKPMLEEEITKDLSDEFKDEKVILPPTISDIKWENDELIVSVQLHRQPEIELKDYIGLKLKTISTADSVEKFIENRIKELRDQNALLEPKEGPAEVGDMVKLIYSIEKDGKLISENKEQEISITDDEFRPIAKNAIGKKANEEFDFEREFSDSKNKYRYFGKIQEVLKKTIPELNDEFVKTVEPELNTLEELNTKIREEGIKQIEEWKESILRNQVNAKLPELIDLKISPETMDMYLATAINNMKKDKVYEQYLQQADGDFEKLSKELRESIINEIKSSRFIEEVSKKENLEVTDEEIMEMAEPLSKNWGVSVDRAKKMIEAKEEIKDELKGSLINKKVLELIIEKAEIEETSSQDKKSVETADKDGETKEENVKTKEEPDTKKGEDKEENKKD
ncbi:MAG: trigger factor [Kosmotogales bacterium]|nr:trigger factor [Kosmotogales bacterium]